MRALIVFFLVIFTMPVCGQTGALSLEQAEQVALENNQQIKVETLKGESAEWSKVKALSAHLPHVELGGMHLWDHKYQEIGVSFGGANLSMPAVTPLTMISLQTSLMIFDGFKSWHEYEAAKLDEQMHDVALSHDVFVVKTDIRTKFYKALGAQALAEVSQQNIKTLEQHLTDANSLYRGGASTKFDILRTEVQLDEARTESLAADDAVVITRARLFEALGIADDGRKLSGQLPDKWADLKDVKVDLNERLDRRVQTLREQISAKMSAAAQSHWYPKVSLFAEKNWYNNANDRTFGDAADFKDAYAVGVKFNWSLFDGGYSYATQQQAALAVKESEQDLVTLDKAIPVEFETWKRRLRLSVASYRARLSAIRKAEESVRLAKSGLLAGVRTSTEVLDATMDLYTTKAKAVQSQIDAVEALGNLELAIGKPIANAM